MDMVLRPGKRFRACIACERSRVTMSSIFVFYGFSGSPTVPVPDFPNGADHDQSYSLAAETLALSLRTLYPDDHIYVQQTWTKALLVQALEAAVSPIRQVHIFSHAKSTRLSLAYRYDNNARLRKRAAEFNALPEESSHRAIKAMREEDALVTGYFARALEKERLAKVRSNHMEGSSWHIWGCHSGDSVTKFEGVDDADIDPYLERFNFRLTAVPGIAVDIAKSLGVICTAASDGGGSEFWHSTLNGKVQRNDVATPPTLPFWLWPTRGSRWVSFDPAGALLPKPLLFGQPQNKRGHHKPRPPKWLIELFWSQRTAPITPGQHRSLAARVNAVLEPYWEDTLDAKRYYVRRLVTLGKRACNFD